MMINSLKKVLPVVLVVVLFFVSCDKTVDVQLPYSNLSSYFSSKAPATQTFTLDPSTVQTVTGAKGTKITFPANSFVDAQGNAITGQVSLELKEIYAKGDMIWADKPTISNGQLLESGGEFFLKATSGGQEVFLNQNYQMEVPVSAATSNPNAMDLFTGQAVADTFNWTPVDTTTGNGGGWVGLDSSGTNYNVYFDSLTWINCDYFYGSGQALTQVNASPTLTGVSLTDVRAYMVFSNINSVTSLNQDPVTNIFSTGSWYQVPVGQQVTIVIIGMDNTQFYLGTVTTTIANSNTISVPMSAVTQTQLENTIDNL